MPSMKTIILSTLATLAAASPISLDARDSIITTLIPTKSIWYAGSSSVYFGAPYGLVQRYNGYDSDISTLNTFAIPPTYANNTCELVFSLGSSSYVQSGAANAQLFYDSQPAAPSHTSNFRDNEFATLQVKQDSTGAYTSVFAGADGSGAPKRLTYKCSDLAKTPNVEVAPQGENVSIYLAGNDGLQVLVY